MATTFEVSPEVPLGPAMPVIDHRQILNSSLRGRIEALWDSPSPLVVCSEDHALLSAINHAFYQHYPLQLSPDVVWITLARGFALHVNLHAETLRDRFVAHQGKQKLVVQRPDFFPGQNNPWPEVFTEFSAQIGQRVGKMRDFIRCDFSTTGPVELAASELMAMDTFQAYFEYEMRAGCGIPRITLTGTVDDWKSIRTRARHFGEYGLEEWSRTIDPILGQFVSAAEGHADTTFWKSLFRFHSGSGPAVMTGWINTFFPYLLDNDGKLEPNPFLADWQERLEVDDQQHWRERWIKPQGRGISAVPPCTTSVPLKVFWGDQETSMRLVGGLMGVSQCPSTFTVQPQCGWAIVYEQEG